jgi:SAM-dependent methyltransferase
MKNHNRVSVEQRFFNTLLEFNHASKHNNKTLKSAATLARQTQEYTEWPNNPLQFWNAEALCWRSRISPEVRNAITHHLSFLKGNNLDLGAGSFSYVKNSTAVDFSEEMLHLNDAPQKVKSNLEEPLPFDNQRFDSVTMPFLINYIQNTDKLIKEAKRVLKPGGILAIIQSANTPSHLHKIHYKNKYGESEIKMLLKQNGFSVRSAVKNIEGAPILLTFGEK